MIDPEDEDIMILENIRPSNITMRNLILDRYRLCGV
jgi:hypothetical protein